MRADPNRIDYKVYGKLEGESPLFLCLKGGSVSENDPVAKFNFQNENELGEVFGVILEGMKQGVYGDGDRIEVLRTGVEGYELGVEGEKSVTEAEINL